jgi:SAM-dependent methyltransferase
VAPDDLKEQVLDANRRFHDELASRGLYSKQPFLNEKNRERVRWIVERLAHEAGDEALLDVGCGTGFILEIARGRFRRLAGIDISRKMLDSVPVPEADLHVAQVEDLPFPDGSFNVITMHSVLHHLCDMDAPFREIFRCLKSGGVFYADESPNAYCLRALNGINAMGEGISPLLREAALSVQKDVSVYEAEYGLDPDLVRTAMYRDKILGGLEEGEVRKALTEAGFVSIDYRYRWYLGQGRTFGDGFDEGSLQMEEYLRSLLPLTRSILKYVSFTATKGDG